LDDGPLTTTINGAFTVLRCSSLLLVLLVSAVYGCWLLVPVHGAETISISNLQYPSTISVNKRLTVNYTVSYSGANLTVANGEYLGAGIFLPPQRTNNGSSPVIFNSSLAEGSPLSSSPGDCERGFINGYPAAGCFFRLADTQGSENVAFSLTDTSAGTFSFIARAFLISYCGARGIYDYNMCVDADAVSQPFSISVLNKFTLTVNVPGQVSITLDSIPQMTPGSIAPELSLGTHEISVPDIVQLNSTSRLRFDDWSDGSRQLTRTLELKNDTEMTASYVTQYYVSLCSDSTLESGWYDSGTFVQFSVNQTQLWNSYRLLTGGFDGWYSGGGQLISKSQSNSIKIDGPVSLVARWNYYPYFLPLLIVVIVGGILYLRRRGTRKRKGEKASLPQ